MDETDGTDGDCDEGEGGGAVDGKGEGDDEPGVPETEGGVPGCAALPQPVAVRTIATVSSIWTNLIVVFFIVSLIS